MLILSTEAVTNKSGRVVWSLSEQCCHHNHHLKFPQAKKWREISILSINVLVSKLQQFWYLHRNGAC